MISWGTEATKGATTISLNTGDLAPSLLASLQLSYFSHQYIVRMLSFLNDHSN